MKKVLITGGTGFIGSRLQKAYRHEWDILAVSSKTMNILDRRAVSKTVKAFSPDYVIHCAAVAETDFCNEFSAKCHAVNVDGTIHIAEACAETKSRLVFLSTEQVFNGNAESGPYTETDTPCPDTVYGENKLEAETKVSAIWSDSIILRLTWMFGMPQREQPVSGNILWDTIRQIMTGRPFRVPVNEYRGLSCIYDLIDRFPKFLDLPAGLYHSGSENPLSRYEAVCLIFRELGLETRIDELVERDLQKYSERPRDVRLDTSRIRAAGIIFPDTPAAIRNCIRESGIAAAIPE